MQHLTSSFIHPLLHHGPLPAVLLGPNPLTRTTKALLYPSMLGFGNEL